MPTNHPTWSDRGTRIAIVLAPLLFLVGSAVMPSLRGSGDSELPVAREHRTAFYIFTTTGIVGTGALIVACLAIAVQIGRTSPRLGLAGAVLTLVGNVLAVNDWGTELVKWEMASPTHDTRAMNALGDSLDNAAGVMVPLQLAGWTTLIGFVLLGVGLRRARLAPRWIAIAIPVGIFLNISSFAFGSVLMMDVANLLMLVAMATLAIRWGDTEPAVGSGLEEPVAPAVS